MLINEMSDYNIKRNITTGLADNIIYLRRGCRRSRYRELTSAVYYMWCSIMTIVFYGGSLESLKTSANAKCCSNDLIVILSDRELS